MHRATVAAILAEHKLRSERVNREAWKGQPPVPAMRQWLAAVLVALAGRLEPGGSGSSTSLVGAPGTAQAVPQ